MSIYVNYIFKMKTRDNNISYLAVDEKLRTVGCHKPAEKNKNIISDMTLNNFKNTLSCLIHYDKL